MVQMPRVDIKKEKKQRKKKMLESFEESHSTLDDLIQPHVRSGNQERLNEACEF